MMLKLLRLLHHNLHHLLPFYLNLHHQHLINLNQLSLANKKEAETLRKAKLQSLAKARKKDKLDKSLEKNKDFELE